MNPSPNDENPQSGPPNRKPRIGRLGIGAVPLLLAIDWTLVGH